MSSPTLPTDVLELCLRADPVADGARIGMVAALDRRRFLRGAALVARDWRAVATRLLAETIVIARTADLQALERALDRGYLQGDRVRALIVDDTAIETDDAMALARSKLRAAVDAKSIVFEDTDDEEETTLHVRNEIVAADIAAFSARLWRVARAMSRLDTVETAFARTLGDRFQHPGVRALDIRSTAPYCGLDNDEWDADWPSIPATVTGLRLGELGENAAQLPPVPKDWARLRRIQIGSRTCAVGFGSAMFTAPAIDLKRLDVVLQMLLEEEPRALFRVGTSDIVSTPNLQSVRLGLTGDCVEYWRDAGLMAYLPPSVVKLEIIVYQGVVTLDYEGEAVGTFRAVELLVEALIAEMTTLDQSSLLQRVAFNVADLADFDSDKLRGCASVVALGAACDARGVRFVVDDEDSGML